jgi:ribonuclease T2
MNALNGSIVQKLFADNIGKNLKSSEIRAAFDEAFGDGAGQRVRVKCKRDGKRQLIQEITIGLYGEFTEENSLAKLLLAARPTKPGCVVGIVDPAGFQ